MPQEFTIGALRVAIGGRDLGAGLVHHSGRGLPYAPGDCRKILKACGITVPMGRLPGQRVHGENFATRDQARRAILEYIGYHIAGGGTLPSGTSRRYSSKCAGGNEPASSGTPAVTALSTASRFPVRRRRPNRPAVDNALRGASWCPRFGIRFIS